MMTLTKMSTVNQTPSSPSPRAKRRQSILLYGRTNSGKTALIGEFAEWLKQKEGKKTRLATADRGGFDTIEHYVEKGLIEVVEYDPEVDDPWVWINMVVRGKVKDASGKWAPSIREDIGCYAFESLTAIAEELMLSMARKAAQGVNIGGGANVSFSVEAGGEYLKISGNNMAHYGVAQSRVVDECWESQKLPGWLLWTASTSRDEDPNATGKVIGPAITGRALTAEVPRWFKYTFRLDAVPGGVGKEARHILYLGNQQDIGSGGATGLGNTRVPLDAPKLPVSIEPASLVQAITLIQDAKEQARVKLAARLAKQ